MSYRPKEKTAKFILRIPDHYNVALEGLVKHKIAKSKNELILTILALFLSDLRAKAAAELADNRGVKST